MSIYLKDVNRDLHVLNEGLNVISSDWGTYYIEEHCGCCHSVLSHEIKVTVENGVPTKVEVPDIKIYRDDPNIPGESWKIVGWEDWSDTIPDSWDGSVLDMDCL